MTILFHGLENYHRQWREKTATLQRNAWQKIYYYADCFRSLSGWHVGQDTLAKTEENIVLWMFFHIQSGMRTSEVQYCFIIIGLSVYLWKSSNVIIHTFQH